MQERERERERGTSWGQETEEFRRLLRRVLRQLPPPAAGTVYTKDIKKTISSITIFIISNGVFS